MPTAVLRKLQFRTLCLCLLLGGSSASVYAQAPLAAIKANGTALKDKDEIKLCKGSSVNFGDASTGTPTSWQWQLEGGTPDKSTQKNPGNVVFNTDGKFTIQLTAKNAEGSTSAEITVNVSSAKPVVDFTFSPDNICGNLPVQFTDASSNGEKYEWDFGGGNTSTLKDPAFRFTNIIGTGSQSVPVKLTVTSEFGCTNTITKNVNVKKVPDPTLGTTDLDVLLFDFNGKPTFRHCAMEETYDFAFINNSETKATNTEYQIDYGDGSPVETHASLNTFNHTYTVGNHILKLTVKSSSGCESVREYNVFLGTNPAGGINNPGNTSICAPQTLKFPITGIANNTPGTQYRITFNDYTSPLTYIHPNVPAEIEHQFTISSCGTNSTDGSTTYSNSFKVTLEISNACSMTSGTSIPIYVSARPEPKIGVYPDSIACVNTTAVFYDESVNSGYVANGTCDYTSKSVWSITPATGWTTSSSMGSLNGNADNFLLWTTGAGTVNVNFTQAGTYTVKLYKGNYCGSNSIVKEICVRTAPKATFSFDQNAGCGTLDVKAINTSPVPACGNDIYTWSVNRVDPENCSPGSGEGFTFINGTNTNSKDPGWRFTRPGKYAVKLVVNSSIYSSLTCPASEMTDTVYIKDVPKITLNKSQFTTCVNGSIAPTATLIPCYTGGIDSYEWTFTGSDITGSDKEVPGSITYAAAGDYSVKLKASNECGAGEATATVKVLALPVAQAGNDATICSGEAFIAGAPAVGGYTYEWEPATGLSSTTAAQPVFKVTNNTGADQTYTLKLTVKAGTDGCSNSDEVTVTVRSAPLISASADASAVCIGESTTLKAAGGLSYEWQPSTGLSQTTGESVMATPLVSTTYTVTGKDANGCTATAGVMVNVKPLPNTNAGEDQVLCLVNEEITLQGAPANGVWSGTGITGQAGSYTFNPSTVGLGVHKVYYTVTENGCSKKDDRDITVTSLQTPNAGNDTTVCQNSLALQLKGTPVGGAWTGNAHLTPSGSFDPSEAGTFTLVYTYGAGSCQVSDEIVVTVLPAIGSNTVFAGQDICINAVPKLLQGSTPTGGDGVYTYQWQESDDNSVWSILTGAEEKDYQPPALTATKYYRRIVSSQLCQGPQQHTSSPITVVVHADAEAGFNAARYTGCTPFVLNNTVIVTDVKPDRNGSYFWFVDGAPLNTTSSPGFPGYTINGEDKTTEIKLRVESQWGCKPAEISKEFITVAGATADFTLDNKKGCSPVTTSFTNTSSRLTGVQHQWDFGNGQTSLLVSPPAVTFEGRNDGRDTTYYITLTIDNGCTRSVHLDSVQVKPKPRAIFGVNATSGCSPMNVQINNASLGTDALYTWDFGNGETRTSTTTGNFIYTYYTGTVQTFPLKMTMENECGTDEMEYKIKVTPNPIKALIAVNGDQLIGCAPHPVSFINTTQGGSSFIWDFDDGSATMVTTAVPQTINHTFEQPGIYNIAIRIANTCTDTTVFREVQVYDGPQAAFVSDNINTCSTDTLVHYINTSTYAGTDPLVFNWLINNSPADNTRDLDFRFRLQGLEEPPKTFLVQLVAGNLYGCTDTATGNLTMSPTPVSGFIVQNGATCVPYYLDLTTNTQYAELYNWYLDEKKVSEQRTPLNIQLDEPDKTYTVTLISGNTYGCVSAPFKLNITTPPKPVSAFEVNNALSCNGILDLRAENQSQGALFYEWYFGDLTPREFTFQPQRHLYTREGEYDLQLVSDNGVCKDTATQIMRVGSKPSALFEVDTALGCKWLTVNFRNLSRNAQSYIWDFGDGTYTGEGNPAHGFGYINSPYTVKLIAAGLYGCADTAVQLNYIRVLTPPTASFRVLPSPVIEIPEYTFRFFDQSTDLKTPDYKWDFGDGNGSSLSASPSYTYPDTGTYQVTLIVLNREDQCSDTASENVIIKGIPGWLQVPNAFQPGSGRAELKRFLPKGTGLKTYRLQIFNGWGEKVFESTQLDDKGRPTEGWDGMVKGKLVQQDVFVWKIQAVFLNGREWMGMKYPGTDYKKVGTVTVVK